MFRPQDPDRLILIKGTEGTSVYTTFKVVDAENHEEECFIRHIPPSVCEKMFTKWEEQVAREVADPDHPRKAPENARQEARLQVLKWTGKDCSRAQINPGALLLTVNYLIRTDNRCVCRK